MSVGVCNPDRHIWRRQKLLNMNDGVANYVTLHINHETEKSYTEFPFVNLPQGLGSGLSRAFFC